MAEQTDENKATEEEQSEAVKAIVEKQNKELRAEICKKLAESFGDRTKEKQKEYENYIMEWDVKFDKKNLDPARVINAWIEIILKQKQIKKDIKKQGIDDKDKMKEELDKKLKKVFKEEFKNEFEKDFKDFKEIQEIYREVYTWHSELLGKDVTKFVKSWVEVEDKLKPIREKYYKLIVNQEDKEENVRVKKEQERLKKEWEENKEEREKERQRKMEERKREREEAIAKQKAEEEEKKRQEEEARKPKFYKAPGGNGPSKLVIKKTHEALKDYIERTKGTQFVCMFQAKDGPKFISEYVKPLQEEHSYFHWIVCKMDDDLGKASKVWFNSWDAYTINQYPCIAIFKDGRPNQSLQHSFFTNFQTGKESFEAIWNDAKILKYDKNAF